MGRLRFAAGFLISAVALYLAFGGVDWPGVGDVLLEANIWLLLAVVPVLLVFIVMRAQRWRLLFCPDTNVRLLSSFGALNIGYMTSNVLPFQLGDLVRVYVLGETERISKPRVLSTVAVERVVDVLVLLAILGVLIPFIDLPRAALITAILFLAGALIAASFIVLAVQDRPRAERWLGRLLRPLPTRLRSSGRPIIDSFLQGLSALSHPTILAQVVLWTAASWLTSSFAIFLILQAFSLDVPAGAAPFLLVATTFGFFVPSSPGGVGVYHAISVRALTSVFAVAHEPASSYALVAHALYLLPPTLLGAAFFWWHHLKLRDLRPWSATSQSPDIADQDSEPAGKLPRVASSLRTPPEKFGRAVTTRRLRILTTLTYYAPHISGVTIYARRLVRRLIARGHAVTVLTSHFDRELPMREELDGATVVRSPVLMRVSKGALMPLFLWQTVRLVASHDVVYLHLPQFEASWVALVAKVLRKPVVTSYQCDIEMPAGPARLVFTPAIRVSHYITGKLSDRIVVTSPEFGHEARLPRRFKHKVSAVYPPIELEASDRNAFPLCERFKLGDGPLVGFVGRLAEEKGIEYLLDSIPRVLQNVPGARFVLAGPTDTVAGERVFERIRHRLDEMSSHVVHIGTLTDAQLHEFYRAIDVLVLASINSTESFGMAQAEAMLAGTPVVASDIPGVREAVRVTGMGETVAPRDAEALAEGIIAVLRNPSRYVRPEREIRERFDPDATAAFYETLFLELLGEGQSAPSDERDSKATCSKRAS